MFQSDGEIFFKDGNGLHRALFNDAVGQQIANPGRGGIRQGVDGERTAFTGRVGDGKGHDGPLARVTD